MVDEEVIRLQEQVKTIFSMIEDLCKKVEALQRDYANRLPLWATMLIGLLTAAVGWLIGR